MWWGVHEGMGWWMVFGGLWMLIFSAIVIVVIVWGVRWQADSQRREEDPLAIAQRRYAQGEISHEEFEAIRATLTGGSPSATARGRR